MYAARFTFILACVLIGIRPAVAAEVGDAGTGPEFYVPPSRTSRPSAPHARVKVAIPAVGAPSVVRESPEPPPRSPYRTEPEPRAAASVEPAVADVAGPSTAAPFSARAGDDGEPPSIPAAVDGPESGHEVEEPPPARPPEPKVLAVVEGREITDRELLRELWSERARETFDWMVGDALLEAELSRLDLDVAENEVDARLREHMEGLRTIFPGIRRDDDLTRAASGMGLAEYRRRSVWSELALRKIMRATIEPDEEVLRKFYAERQARYIEPDQALVAQIFIAPEPATGDGDASGPAEWAEAERRIVEAHNRLRLGEDFRAVATAYSSGGSLPHWVGHGELMRELDVAAFSLRVGAMSGPIRSALGYHILVVQDRKERRAPPFEEVRDRLREEYDDGLFVARAGEFMAGLRERAIRDKRLVVEDGGLEFPVE